MATSDRTISKPIVNILTKAQYQGISSPSADEFYLITDDAAVSAGTGISVNSAGGETIVSLDSSYGLTASDISTGTDTTNKLVSAKTISDVISGLGGGTVTDVQVGGTSIVTSGVANLITNSTYNSSSNKIATMSDIPSVSDTKVKLTSVSSGNEYPLILGPSSITSGNTYEANYNSSVTLNANSQQLTLKAVKLVYDSNCFAILNINGYSGDASNNIPTVKFTSAKANTSGGSDYNVRLTGISTPIVDTDAANRKYVNDAVGAVSDTKVTNTLATTTKYYVTGTTSSSTNTGTQSFDSGVFVTTTAGQLQATSYKVTSNATIQYNSTDSSIDFVF